jgi:hypothetical protein
VLAVISAVVLSGAASGARSQISTVAGTDAPSVRATNDFLFKLQDMDAQLVNMLLVNGDTSVAVPRSKSEDLYEKDRQDADGDLESATVALAGNTDALAKLHAVTDSFGEYQARATRTLAADERDGGTVAGQTPPTVATGGTPIFSDYMDAYYELFGDDGKGGLMAAAKDLEQSSRSAIDSSADSATGSLNAVVAEYTIFGILLIGGLAGLQVFVFRRFHRVVNPALAGATVAALVLTIGGVAGGIGAADDFHTAKSDAFNSVLALGEANALSAGLNSDESRWLLAHDHPDDRTQFEKSFVQGENAVADLPDGASVTSYAFALQQEVGARNQDNLDGTRMTTNSSFGQEFHNITFPNEADAAMIAFTAYNQYVQDDLKLRAMPQTTPEEMKSAIDYDTDAATPGSSDKVFNDYSTALASVTAINEAQFEAAMPAAKSGIATWVWLPYVLAVLMIGLMVLGLRPRLNEYR